MDGEIAEFFVDHAEILTFWTNHQPYLDRCGGIANEEGIVFFSKAIKKLDKLSEKCFSLLVLKATKSTVVLERFLTEGGWNLLNSWLTEAKKSENMDLVLEVLKILQALPLRVDHLRCNNTPKIVKKLSLTAKDSAVQSMAVEIKNQWVVLVKAAAAKNGNGDSRSNKDKGKNSSKTKPGSSNKSGDDNSKGDRKTFKSAAKSKQSSTDAGDRKAATVKRGNSADPDSVPDKKTKMVPKQPKKISMSAGFMDALNSAPPTGPKRPIKRKMVTKRPQCSSSSVEAKDAIPSGEAGDFGEDSDEAEQPFELPAPRSPKLDKNGRPKKSVRWAGSNSLEAIRYFECEEGERVNVTSHAFKDAMLREKLQERSQFGEHHHSTENVWRHPQRLTIIKAPLAEPGQFSTEQKVQAERELTVLQSIFLTPDMIPDSPAEPESENVEFKEPKIIPLTDANGVGSINDHTETPFIEDAMMNDGIDNGEDIVDVEMAETEEAGEMVIDEHQPQHPMLNGPLIRARMPYGPPMMPMPGYYPPMRPGGPPPMGMEWMGPNMRPPSRMRGPMPFPPPPGPFRANGGWRPRNHFREQQRMSGHRYRADFYR